MTKIVGKLEERGLVQRSPHPTDGRQVILSPTGPGRSMLAGNRRAREPERHCRRGERGSRRVGFLGPLAGRSPHHITTFEQQ